MVMGVSASLRMVMGVSASLRMIMGVSASLRITDVSASGCPSVWAYQPQDNRCISLMMITGPSASGQWVQPGSELEVK
jgi:hypothetical protein